MAFSIQDFSDIKKLGEGGMGSIYLATQVALDRKVVIKELSPNMMKDPKLVKRFENEAKSAAGLDHDNIIRVFDFGEDRHSFFISMEYVDGLDLEQLMRRPSFPREIGLMIFLQAMKGLNYAHKQGIAHCDIKPGNILVSKTGKVKVVDFGLAHATTHKDEISDPSGVFITPRYMPPEVASGSLHQDIKMDIWASGVLAYRIICGRVPFVAVDMQRLVYSIVHEKEKDIRAIAPEIPANLAYSVHACLIKDPHRRPGSLDNLIDSLENYLFDLGVKDIEKLIMKFVAGKDAAVATISNAGIDGNFPRRKMAQMEKTVIFLKAAFSSFLPLRKAILITGIISIVSLATASIFVIAGKNKSVEPGAIIFAGPSAAAQKEMSEQIVSLKRPADAEIRKEPVQSYASVPNGQQKHVSVLPPDKRTGLLKFSIEPGGATVMIDGEKVASSDLEVGKRLRPGNHSMVVFSEGYESFSLILTMEPNATQFVSVSLKQRVIGTGFLHIFSYPWSDVYIDNSYQGTAPTPQPLSLSEGDHLVVLKRDGFKPDSETVNVAEGKETRIKVQLEK